MSALNKDFVHETALVEKGASTGFDCDIGPFCLVGSNVRLEIASSYIVMLSSLEILLLAMILSYGRLRRLVINPKT